MLIVEVVNEVRSSTVDSVHIALAEMPYAFDIRNPSPTSGKLIKEPSQARWVSSEKDIKIRSVVTYNAIQGLVFARE